MCIRDRSYPTRKQKWITKPVYQLGRICHEYNLKISTIKTKIMTFKGKIPIRSKIIIDNKIIGQISHNMYLRCDVHYEYGNDINSKINRYQSICGTFRKSLSQFIRKYENYNVEIHEICIESYCETNIT